MKKTIFVLFCVVQAFLFALAPAGAVEQPRVIAILAIATDDVQIGTGARTNLENVRFLLNQIREIGGLEVKEYVVSAGDFTCAKITRAVSRLNVRDNDTVIFYYAGHGYRVEPPDSGDKFPLLQCHPHDLSKNLSLSAIASTLFAKKHRLTIAIGDACNVVQPQAVGVTKGLFKPSKEALTYLFAGYKGMIIFSAAKPGEFAYYPPDGSYFTNQLLKVIDDTMINSEFPDTPPTWETIAPKAVAPIKVSRTWQVPQYDAFPDDPERRLRRVE
jgi:hypothetical protein